MLVNVVVIANNDPSRVQGNHIHDQGYRAFVEGVIPNRSISHFGIQVRHDSTHYCSLSAVVNRWAYIE